MQEQYGSEWLSILHSPEFLTQRCAHVDFQCPARNIIGVPGWPHVTPAMESVALALGTLYRTRFPGVPCLLMQSDESELVKLAQNAFFATKVAFFNLVYELAQAKGLSFENVRAGMLSDGRIAHAHTAVPGPSGELGFGGACLPKDTANLETLLREAQQWHAAGLLEAVLEFNALQRAKTS
jgi:UDPglucose 6-dehydrogenase